MHTYPLLLWFLDWAREMIMALPYTFRGRHDLQTLPRTGSPALRLPDRYG